MVMHEVRRRCNMRYRDNSIIFLYRRQFRCLTPQLEMTLDPDFWSLRSTGPDQIYKKKRGKRSGKKGRKKGRKRGGKTTKNVCLPEGHIRPKSPILSDAHPNVFHPHSRMKSGLSLACCRKDTSSSVVCCSSLQAAAYVIKDVKLSCCGT